MKTIYFFKNRTSNGESDPNIFKGGNLSIVIQGNLDGAKIKYQFSYDEGTTWNNYIVNGKVFEQEIEGKEIEIYETAPLQIRAVLENSNSLTQVTVFGVYLDKLMNYGIQP